MRGLNINDALSPAQTKKATRVPHKQNMKQQCRASERGPELEPALPRIIKNAAQSMKVTNRGG